MKTNEEYVDMWINKLKNVNNKSINTVKMYKSHLLKFSKFINKPFSEVDCFDIEDFLSNSQEKSTTKQHKQTVICRFYNWMYDHKFCDRHPKLEREGFSKEERNPQFLEKEQQEIILNYLLSRINVFKVSCRSHKIQINANSITEAKKIYAEKYNIPYLTYIKAEPMEDVFTRERDYMVTYFIINSGLRAHESLNLKVEKINFEKHEVKVIGKRNKERVVHINAYVNRALKEYIDKYGLTEYVFPNADMGKWAKSSMDSLYTNISKATGIDVHVHQLRHTYGQNLYDSGKVPLEIIQKQMGHSSIKITQIYAKVRDRHVKDAVENI